MSRDVDEMSSGPSTRSRSPHAPASERNAWVLSHLLIPMGRYAAPALAALALVVVMAGEPAELDADLHLVVADSAQPGATLPLRALLYTGLQAIEGPSLQAQAVDVELVTAMGQRVATTRLVPAAAPLRDIEGELRLPDELGRYRLFARTRLGERVLRVTKELRIEVSLEERVPEGRSLRALQQFAAGPVQVDPGQIAPDSLRVQVRGGACVPERSCEALVHVGQALASLRLEPNDAVTPDERALVASPIGQEVVSLRFVTHGPEAELWLIAERDGHRVARRAVRLPIAMAALSVRVDPLIVRVGSPVSVRAFGAEEGCIVDVFERGSWARTSSRPACERPLSLEPMGVGSRRIQVRRDAFSAPSAGVAVVYVAAAAEQPREIGADLARAAAKSDPDDPVVRACLTQACEPDAAMLGYLAALLETGIFEPPTAVTGYADMLASAHERQARLRVLSLIALAFGGVALALSIGKQGLGAGARARQLLDNAEPSPTRARRARLRTLALVAASVLSLLLVFAVIGLYVLARGGY